MDGLPPRVVRSVDSPLPMTNPYRLCSNVRPVHYRIRIEPDLDALSFHGRVTIDVEVEEATDRIFLNALDLELTGARVEQEGVSLDAGVEYIPEEQRVGVVAPVAPGSVRLDLEFKGALNGLLVGFYRSTYVDGEGVEQTVVSTQFEASDARRAFPCFDEPVFKATFAITLVVPAHLEAISNYPEVSRTDLGDGRHEVEFATSMKMSSYLVAFVVGPFEATEPRMVDGIPVRVVVPKGKLHLADFALECSVAVLEYFTDYYGIPYPGRKLDHVAIPDFAFGAMENLGCITYRESALLVDPDNSSQVERLRVLDVVGHEIAHMWFGDLVTMEWWDGIWLNEAFATFMEMKSTDAIRPEWKRWLDFAGQERPWAYGVDSLHSTRPVEFEVQSPDEANEMFDALTYGKGSSILRMMEQYMGEETFRRGVRRYLNTHAYSNTVTDDLWRSLDAEAGFGVVDTMKTWIHQRGYPRLDVTVEGNRIRVTQQRFLSLPDETDSTLWHVPLVVRGVAAGEEFHLQRLMTGSETVLDVEGEPEWVVANAGGHGYYRVAYQIDDFARLTAHLGELDSLERFCVLDDTWALVENGSLPVSGFLDLVGEYREEREQTIVQRLIQTVGKVSHHLVSDGCRPAFEEWVGRLFRPIFDSLGWEPRPEDSELDRRLRGSVLSALGRIAGDAEIVARAEKIGARWLENGDEVDPDVGQACLVILAWGKSHEIWDQLRAAHDSTPNPQRRLRILQAMAAAGNQAKIGSLFDAIREGWVKSQDVGWVVGEMLSDRLTGADAWRGLRSDWPGMSSRMPGMTIARALEGLPSLSQESVAADVRGFFAETQVPTAGKSLAQNLERLEVNVRLRASQTDSTTAYFV